MKRLSKKKSFFLEFFVLIVLIVLIFLIILKPLMLELSDPSPKLPCNFDPPARGGWLHRNRCDYCIKWRFVSPQGGSWGLKIFRKRYQVTFIPQRFRSNHSPLEGESQSQLVGDAVRGHKCLDNQEIVFWISFILKFDIIDNSLLL